MLTSNFEYFISQDQHMPALFCLTSSKQNKKSQQVNMYVYVLDREGS